MLAKLNADYIDISCCRHYSLHQYPVGL